MRGLRVLHPDVFKEDVYQLPNEEARGINASNELRNHLEPGLNGNGPPALIKGIVDLTLLPSSNQRVRRRRYPA